MLFLIGGIQKTTLLDYPGKVAAIVFTQGCNFRCGYCHNPSLIDINNPSATEKHIKSDDFFSFLKNRINKLDGIVITGGEPTIQSGLYDFIEKIKKMNFLVKLDTNGTNPKVIEQLITEKMLDYIAMDIKAPLEKYNLITGKKINTKNILKSIELIKNSNVDYEFRTTVLQSQLSFADFDKIGQMIKGSKRYYLQKFIPSGISDNTLISQKTYSDDDFKIICEKLKKYIDFVDFR